MATVIAPITRGAIVVFYWAASWGVLAGSQLLTQDARCMYWLASNHRGEGVGCVCK
jgi:hypothetical protein